MSNINPRKQVIYTTTQIQQLISAVHDGAVDSCIALADAAAADGTPSSDIGSYINANRPLVSPARDGSSYGVIP